MSNLDPVKMNEYNRKCCLPTTRLDVIKSISDWITDESTERKNVLWLYGLAGSGKSTLSTTIAWMMRDLHRLGGFFFFDHDIPERNSATLVRTLAYQLALLDTRIGDAISQIVEKNPRIAEMPLDFQITNLLSAKAMEPVVWSEGPIVLVVDALDESGSHEHRKDLLKALSNNFHNLPSFVRFIVVSRHESDIERTFGSHSAVHPYPLDIDSATNHGDILEFVRQRLDQIRTENDLGSNWPGDDNIGALAKGAGGLFVWASTACLYIDGYNPDGRLKELITQHSVINFSKPFAQLDDLYKTGLQSAGLWDDPSFRSDCRDILGVVLCARIPLSYAVIDSLLELSQNRPCRRSILRLACVFRTGETEGIRILHPSFHDYLSERCSIEPWSIDLELHNKMLTLHCIKLLDTELKENILGLTLPHPVENQTLPEALSYACRFWVDHICLISCGIDDIADLVYNFLCRHLPHWMEALAILNCHDLTIRSLQNLLALLKVCFPAFLLSACD